MSGRSACGSWHRSRCAFALPVPVWFCLIRPVASCPQTLRNGEGFFLSQAQPEREQTRVSLKDLLKGRPESPSPGAAPQVARLLPVADRGQDRGVAGRVRQAAGRDCQAGRINQAIRGTPSGCPSSHSPSSALLWWGIQSSGNQRRLEQAAMLIADPHQRAILQQDRTHPLPEVQMPAQQGL